MQSRAAGVRAASRAKVHTKRTAGPEEAAPGWWLVQGGLGGWGGCVEAEGRTGGAGTAPVLATTCKDLSTLDKNQVPS